MMAEGHRRRRREASLTVPRSLATIEKIGRNITVAHPTFADAKATFFRFAREGVQRAVAFAPSQRRRDGYRRRAAGRARDLRTIDEVAQILGEADPHILQLALRAADRHRRQPQ